MACMLPGLMPDEVPSNGVNPRTRILFLMPLVIQKLNEQILNGSGFSRGEVSIAIPILAANNVEVMDASKCDESTARPISA
jgi:hypothetical protein